MNTRPRQSTGSEGLEFFCRHLVALCVTYQTTGSDSGEPPHFAAYSGTLIQIQNTVCFLTAGHVLRNVEAALKSDQVTICNTILADTFGLSRVSEYPIPFDLKNARLFYVDEDKAGLDFGVIVLDPYYVRLLSYNGTVALQEQNWISQSAIEFDGYMMLGLPEEFISGHLTGSGEGTVSPTMFGVHRLESPPDDRPPTLHSQFVGQLDRALAIKSVKGMSGGPIFGFRLEPEMSYWVVALQSSWDPTKRIVYGCSLPILASLMTKWAADPNLEP